MNADRFDELNARWAALESQYDAVRQAVEARVTRWMWSEGEHFNLRPLFFERNVIYRAPLQETEPQGRNVYEYGFDAQGRIVAVYGYGREDESLTHDFYIYDDRGVEAVHYGGDSLTRVGRLYGDPPALYADVQRGGRYSEEYRRDDGQIVTIKTQFVVADNAPYEKQSVEVIRYRRDGVIERIERTDEYDYHGDVEREQTTVYQRLPDGVTEDDLITAAREELVAVIPELLRRESISEPVYCLILEYNTPDQGLMPELVLGFEVDRAAWLADEDNVDDAFMIWSPQLIAPEREDGVLDIQLELPACRNLNQHVRMSGKRGVEGRLMRGVAADLTLRDWSRILTTTPDFIVFSTDYEKDRLEDDLLLASIPQHLRDMLEDKGLL